MKYIEKYHVHYYYTNRNFDLKLFYIGKYLQETALAAFDSMEGPRQELTEKNLAFILSKISFVFENKIKKFDDIKVETWALPPKSAAFIRNYRIFNETSGTCAVLAASSWALVNMLEKTIVNPNTLSENFNYATDEEDIGFVPVRRIKIPDEINILSDNNFIFEKEIFYNDIDENMHMNNTVYLDIIDNALHKIKRDNTTEKLRTLDLSYNYAAEEGDILSVWGIKINDEIYLKGKIGEINCFDAKATFDAKECFE